MSYRLEVVVKLDVHASCLFMDFLPADLSLRDNRKSYIIDMLAAKVQIVHTRKCLFRSIEHIISATSFSFKRPGTHVLPVFWMIMSKDRL